MVVLTGCGGASSTLDPAGVEAATIARLFWLMAIGAGVVWLVVVAIALHAGRRRDDPPDRRRAHRWLIVGGGVIIPTVVLGALLVHGLILMPQLREPAPHDGLRIAVSGEQWWWRVTYRPDDAAPVVLANEIRLPVGQRVEFVLTSPDVIHSFWIPSLGGKLDMIPGRTTTLVLEPTRTGTFHGACAEYCGTSHAFMQLAVVVMEPEPFARWLQHQAAPAASPSDPIARRGESAFQSTGCGACHSVRGTAAAGVVGPDLTHVGSRLRLAAGTLPNDAAGFQRWIADTHSVKPEAPMPEFGMLPEAELHAIASYLEGLQ
ncbi:cytochrome c oxidase subunit II [Lysobacter sp. F6437]|uniref:cytochrome c oxidase subunit II n=1 Tax=Lysobacter sp. F6437 TaxID=3459296 RepID=UPI00403D96A9